MPLVGMALWGAERALVNSPSGWLFPRYAADQNIKATHASNTAWLKRLLKDTKTTHSFRHAMRDRSQATRGQPWSEAHHVGGND